MSAVVGPSVPGPTSLPAQFRQPFRFLSAYAHCRPDGELEVSTRHADHGCPDFIFYEGASMGAAEREHRITLQKRLSLPSLAQIDSCCGPMPNLECGSDHLPIAAHFLLH